MESSHEIVVIGGSQAGLAMGYYLARQGRDFVILEGSQRIGDGWRNRYDSLQLFTPARFSSLPGMRQPGNQNRYPTKDEMADYLEAYAAEFNLPVRLNTWVEQLTWDGERYRIAAGDHSFLADQVVVATGAERAPHLPPFASELDPSIFQVHSSDYHKPGQLPAGDVLVVGVGNSGADLALELADSRQVYLSGKPPGMLPSPPHPALAGLMFAVLHWVITRSNPLGRKLISKLSAGGTPVEGTTEADFAEAGIERLPRTTGIENGQPVFADGTRQEVATVVWATGFRLEFSWIDLPVFQENGAPRQVRGVVEEQPGLYFLGLPFMYAASSNLIPGVGRDAKFVAGRIGERAARSAKATSAKTETEQRAMAGVAHGRNR
ncbi:MAG: NAD(P)/FAD-dependent oxidoreductase [Anaerolineales bacterium]